MSTYEYCEFQARDRPLTEEEQKAVVSLSSRVEPHPWRAVFTYHWSSFPRDRQDILAQYYDAMIFLANWGTRQLLFRFPRGALDLERLRPYCLAFIDGLGSTIWLSEGEDYIILDIHFDEEGAMFMFEGEGWLASLIQLRDDLLRQDERCLYLAWLKGISMEGIDPEVLEPPVPVGLRKLSPARRDFVELFEIDSYLIEVASALSAPQVRVDEEIVRQAISGLDREEANEFLLRLTQGEAQLSAKFNRRLREAMDAPKVKTPPRRTVGELLEAARQAQEDAERRRAAEAEARHIREMEALAPREVELWEKVESLIQVYNRSNYDQATELLYKLRDLAIYQGMEVSFQERLSAIQSQYPTRSGLLQRLRKVGEGVK